tara:strand:+ start:1092 stop:1361 length:270 start_codon:yes stop_codon:yes gene_type:complete
MEINVKKLREDEFEVVVKQNGTSTSHIVTVSDDDWQKLTDKMCSKELLLEKSFEFLLEREPKESILGAFSIMTIAKYFPEYPDEIKKLI